MAYQLLSGEQSPSAMLAEDVHWDLGHKPLPPKIRWADEQDSSPGMEAAHWDLLHVAYRDAMPPNNRVVILNANQSLRDIECPARGLIQLVIDKRKQGAAAEECLAVERRRYGEEDGVTYKTRELMSDLTFDHDARRIMAHETDARPPHNVRAQLGLTAMDGSSVVVERSLVYVRPTASGEHLQTSPLFWVSDPHLRKRNQPLIPRNLCVRVPYMSEGPGGHRAVRISDARIIYPPMYS